MNPRARWLQATILLVAVAGLSTPAAGTGPEWTYLGLGGNDVHSLMAVGSFLYAGADSGLLRKSKISLDTLWIPMSLDSVAAQSLLALDDTTFLASALWDSAEDLQVI